MLVCMRYAYAVILIILSIPQVIFAADTANSSWEDFVNKNRVTPQEKQVYSSLTSHAPATAKLPADIPIIKGGLTPRRAIDAAVFERYTTDRFRNEGLSSKAIQRNKEIRRGIAATTPEGKAMEESVERSIKGTKIQQEIAKENAEIRKANVVIEKANKIINDPTTTAQNRANAQKKIIDAQADIIDAQVRLKKATATLDEINNARRTAAQERIQVEAAKRRGEQAMKAIAEKNQSTKGLPKARELPMRGMNNPPIPKGGMPLGGKIPNQGLYGFGPMIADKLLTWMYPSLHDLTSTILDNQAEIKRLTLLNLQGEGLTLGEMDDLIALEEKTDRLRKLYDQTNTRYTPIYKLTPHSDSNNTGTWDTRR